MTTGIDEPDQIEVVRRGLQEALTDKFFKARVTTERDPTIRGYVLRATWATISRTQSSERLDEVPATFRDYLKQWIPFVTPKMKHLTVNIIHQCPHINALPEHHWDWVVNGNTQSDKLND